MRDISRPLFKILNGDRFEEVAFLTIRLAGGSEGSAIRLTSAGESTTFGDAVYSPMNFGRGSVQEVLAAESQSVPSVTIVVSNVDTQMATLLGRAELEGAWADLWLTDRRLVGRQRDAFRLTQGEVRSPQVSERSLVFQIYNVIGLTERLRVPGRIHQPLCNYAYGSAACGVELNMATVRAGCLAGSTEWAVRAEASAVTATIPAGGGTTFYAHGYAVGIDGPNATQARPIQRVEESSDGTVRVHLRRPLLNPPAEGDRFLFRRGCGKTVGDCAARQGTALNHGGFPGVPYGRLRPIKSAEPGDHASLTPPEPTDGELCL